MAQMLDFEKPIAGLEEKIQELRTFARENDVDLTDEVLTLENRLQDLKKEIYNNLSPWDRVRIARHPERPTTEDYIKKIFDSYIEIRGDRRFADDPALVCGLGLLEGQPVTIIGHQKGRNTKDNIKRNFGMPHPEGYRKAYRCMEQAEKFARPVVAFIDTSGAYCGLGAEERGQGEAIAANLMLMARLKVPILVVVIGEGGSGGALGIGVGDRVAMLSSSVYSVISPEGLASILWKDAGKASDAAAVMKMTATDLIDLNIIDTVIEEPEGGAHRFPEETITRVGSWLKEQLPELKNLNTTELLEQRYKKYREIGQFC